MHIWDLGVTVHSNRKRFPPASKYPSRVARLLLLSTPASPETEDASVPRRNPLTPNHHVLLQVVFDRFDKDGTGCLSAADAREALEYMGRDVNGEGCASWLVDKERKRGDISFVDFTTA